MKRFFRGFLQISLKSRGKKSECFGKKKRKKQEALLKA
jgi:hypothetical protein